MNKRYLIATPLLLLACLLSASRFTSSVAQTVQMPGLNRPRQEGTLSPHNLNEIADFRQAGLHNSKSKVPAIIEVLRAHPQSAYVYTATHALAQMGATEALPVMDTFVEKSVMMPSLDPDLSNFVVVAQSELIWYTAS